MQKTKAILRARFDALIETADKLAEAGRFNVPRNYHTFVAFAMGDGEPGLDVQNMGEGIKLVRRLFGAGKSVGTSNFYSGGYLQEWKSFALPNGLTLVLKKETPIEQVDLPKGCRVVEVTRREKTVICNMEDA